jgi:hypothetical protein
VPGLLNIRLLNIRLLNIRLLNITLLTIWLPNSSFSQTRPALQSRERRALINQKSRVSPGDSIFPPRDRSLAAYVRYAGGRINDMNARSILLLTTLTTLVSSSPGSAQFFLFQNPFFQNPVTLDNLDGNYRTIAACAYEHLVHTKTGLSRTEPRPGVIRIASAGERWELSFVNDEGGRQTRLDWTAGDYPSEFVLGTVRACAA